MRSFCVGAQACDCISERLWVRHPLEEMKYLIFSFPRSSQSAALTSATQYTMLPEFGRKNGNVLMGTESLNENRVFQHYIRFPGSNCML